MLAAFRAVAVAVCAASATGQQEPPPTGAVVVRE
jgi:hypothetical protein